MIPTPVLAVTLLVMVVPCRLSVPRLPPSGRHSEYRFALGDPLGARLERAAVGVSPRSAIRIWGGVAAGGAVSALLLVGRLDAPAGLLGAAVGGAAPPVVLVARGDRARRRVSESLPEMLELLARSLRGGADLHTALHELASGANEAGRTLQSVMRRVAAGERIGEAFDRWATDLEGRDVSVVRAVIRVGGSTGGSMAGALDRAAATIRERGALHSEIRALTSQSRASALVIAASPLGFLALLAGTDPESSRVLFATFLGRVCLTAGLVLDGLGLWWMRHLTGGTEE